MNDNSVCKWSVQENGMCPYKEMMNMIMNDFDKEKTRCEGKQCLQILLDNTGLKTEKELVHKYTPDWKKPSGPANSTKLLSNINIEAVLKDFSFASVNKNTVFPNGPFYHIKFEMSDFLKSMNSELRDIDFKKLHKEGFKTFGCVLNTDKWSGPGKHWVCIFGTIEPGEKYQGVKVAVEYFNSSGRTVDAYPSLLEWGKKKVAEGIDLKIENAIPYQGVQRSRTECGVWCLCYIKCRLENKPPDYFIEKDTKDSEIIQARKYLFSEN